LKARQNPLAKLEAFMQRLVEGPFAWLFPSQLEPVEVARKLERAMEDNTLLQGEGRRLAPNVYDIYMSMKDHQQMSQSLQILIRDWQNRLIEFAKHRHFTLRTNPIIRLHADTSLHTGIVRIESGLADRQGGDGDGAMSTQAISAEQMAQLLRTQLAAGQPVAGTPMESSPQQLARPLNPSSVPDLAGSSNPSTVLPPQADSAMPQAWLTIRLPQAQQQIYPIKKRVVNIGRQLSNDIIVEDKRVSRNHAQIKYQSDGQFLIFDLGSTNGITINNIPHMRQHVLHNGDRFIIGSYDFYFERR
jgi:hypothetical protein